MPVDPQIQALLDMGAGVPATNTLSVHDARMRSMRGVSASWRRRPQLAR